VSAPSLQGGLAEQHYPTGLQREVRLAAASSATGGRAALAALAANEVAVQLPPALDQFVDELAGLLTCPITVDQREKLQSALIDAIDARFATLIGWLPA
jgi:hypothetical protein